MKKIILLIVLMMSGCAATVPKAQYDNLSKQSMRCRAAMKSDLDSKMQAKAKESAVREVLRPALMNWKLGLSMQVTRQTGKDISVRIREIMIDSRYKTAIIVIDFMFKSVAIADGYSIFIERDGKWYQAGTIYETGLTGKRISHEETL